MTNPIRFGGIASGLDTEQIVKDLMRVEHMKVDKIHQDRQVIEWQQEQFRELTNQARSFRDKYFDILSPELNMTSPNSLQRMQASSNNSELVTVAANSDAFIGDIEFGVIESAKAARFEASDITEGESGERLSLGDTMAQVSEKLAGGDLDFDGETGNFTLKINSVEITVNQNDTLRQTLRNISNSEAGVQANYSDFSDTFIMTSRLTGEGTITANDGGNFFTALGINMDGLNAEGVKEIGDSGRDARFQINGHEGSRASNNFTIDGITYNINQNIEVETDEFGVEIPQLATISTSVDVDGIYDMIEGFVEDYNKIIEDFTGKLKEESFRDFRPLTDAQKDEMSEDDIEKWEEKAQSGLLRRDSSLENFLRNMRSAFYESVGEHHLTEIGIQTSDNYQDNGKLVLSNGGQDLRNAIVQNPDKVVELFTRRSDISYSATLSGEERSQRRQESGLAHRISDIFNDNIRTSRDTRGRKGIFLEKAGVEGDTTYFSNTYQRQMQRMNERIDSMNTLLARQEQRYWNQFTSMESALQELHSQGDWLQQNMAQLN